MSRIRSRAVKTALALAVVGATVIGGVVPLAYAAGVVTVRITDTTPRADGSVPFSSTGTWAASSVSGPDGGGSRYTGSTGAKALWTPVATAAGRFRVEAAIPDAQGDPAVTYSVTDGDGITITKTVDQTAARGQWAELGHVDVVVGERIDVKLARTTTGGAYTRVGSVRLVEDPVAVGLPYSESFADGLAGWVGVGSSTTAPWSTGSAQFDYIGVDNRSAVSGSYLRPETEISLTGSYRLRTSIRVEEFGSGAAVSLLTDVLAPYSVTAGNLAIQFTASGVRIAMPNTGPVVCSGKSPLQVGEWAQLEVVRAGGITAVLVNGDLVAAVEAGPAGGTFAFGGYKALAQFGAVGVEQLSTPPVGHPTTAVGCPWAPGTGALADQPIVINQTGYDLGGAKRFTAPNAVDGETFKIVDASGGEVFSGAVTAQVGDFTAFDPAGTGPFRILIDGNAGETRCMGSKVYVTLKATSHESMPVALQFETSYGVKSFTSVEPDASATHAFASRKVSIPAGTATVTATDDAGGGQSITAVSTVGYPARNCAG